MKLTSLLRREYLLIAASCAGMGAQELVSRATAAGDRPLERAAVVADDALASAETFYCSDPQARALFLTAAGTPPAPDLRLAAAEPSRWADPDEPIFLAQADIFTNESFADEVLADDLPSGPAADATLPALAGPGPLPSETVSAPAPEAPQEEPSVEPLPPPPHATADRSRVSEQEQAAHVLPAPAGAGVQPPAASTPPPPWPGDDRYHSPLDLPRSVAASDASRGSRPPAEPDHYRTAEQLVRERSIERAELRRQRLEGFRQMGYSPLRPAVPTSPYFSSPPRPVIVIAPVVVERQSAGDR